MRRFYSLAVALLTVVTVSAQTPTASRKLSPWLQLQTHQQAVHRRAASTTIDVLAKLTDDADEQALAERYQLEVVRRIGKVLIVRLPLANVQGLSQDAQVVRVEAERAAGKLLDVVPQQIAADQVLTNAGGQLPQAFTGAGTVVGVVDVGFDYTHPMFKDKDWRTRVRWVGEYLEQPYRQLTDTTAILKAMFSPDPYEIHGTHVTGIAAGKPVMRLFAGENDHAFQGIAQEADIALGAISLTGDNPIVANGATSVPALEAFHDIFAYADAQKKPCVINFSAGVTQTFANDRQLEEEAIRTLTSTPGHAIVVAAGNSGAYPYLMHKPADLTEAGAGIQFINDEGLAFFAVMVKMKNTQTLRIRYMDSSYQSTHGEITVTPTEIPAQVGYVEKRIGAGIYLRTLYADLYERNDDYSVIYVGCDNTFPDSDGMLLTIEGEGDADLLADVLCAPLKNVTTVDNHDLAERGSSIGWPGSMDEVITVGNIGWRYQVFGTFGAGINEEAYEKELGEGYLAKSSSRGPTLDGRIKPDVCAPGVCVVSAMNNGLGWGLPTSTADALEQQYQYYYMGYVDEPENPNYDENNPADVWNAYHALIAMTGTSMSAPAVTGTIALWMQADPTLTTDRIKDVIAHSSRQPEEDLTYPNNLYGYGEIDAYKGLLYLLGLTGIEALSQHQPQRATITLRGREVAVTFPDGYAGPTTLRLYSTDGKLLRQTAGTTLSLGTLTPGVYALQVTTSNSATTGSTLVRIK